MLVPVGEERKIPRRYRGILGKASEEEIEEPIDINIILRAENTRILIKPTLTQLCLKTVVMVAQ